MSRLHRARPAMGLVGAVLLAGCQTFSPDGGMSVTSSFARQQLGTDVIAIHSADDAALARSRVQQLIKRTMTANTAVQIALLNNRGLQAAYNELGIAEATLVAESLPPNPKLSLSRLTGADLEIERRIVVDILELATLPARAEMAQDRFRQAQLRAAGETARVAAQARRAFYGAVASQQLATQLAGAQSAAANAAKLAARLGQSGALNKLDQAREQVFYAEMTAQHATALQQANAEHEKLVRALGLWGADLAFKLPASLPSLPARPRSTQTIERDALAHRVDVQIARIEVDTLAKSYGLSRATRFINALDLGAIDKTTRTAEGASDRARGIEVEFQVPLFDFGESRLRQAEQTYMAAVNRLAEKAVNARSQARQAYHDYRAAYDIAAHYQREIMPLRKIIAEEMTLRYGAMQIDVFSLLTEQRQRIAASIASLEAQRKFWLAAAALSDATIGSGGADGDQASTIAMNAGDSAPAH